MNLRNTAIGLCLTALAAAAHAAPITYTYHIEVSSISGSPANGGQIILGMTDFGQGSIRLGDTLTGMFTMDQDQLYLPPSMQQAHERRYENQQGQGHSLSFSTADGGRFQSPNKPGTGVVQIYNDSYDQFAITSYDPAYDSSFVTSLRLVNTRGGLFQSLDLPGGMQLNQFDYTWFLTSWTTDWVRYQVQGKITALERVAAVNEVPAPATLPLMLTGALCLGWMRRKSGA